MAGTDGPTSGTTAPSLPPVKMHALDRSSKDTQAANDGARAAAQSTILINGRHGRGLKGLIVRKSTPRWGSICKVPPYMGGGGFRLSASDINVLAGTGQG
jgi:hypothetical protein